MNIKEYISSGIVESYVLGLASETERSEFEQLCARYPELVQARNDFEKAWEKQAMQNAITPSADLKEKIWTNLHQAPVRKIKPQSIALKWIAAASIILLAGSLIWNLSLYNKNRKLQKDYNNNVAKLDEIEKDIRVLQQNPSVKMASMKGMGVSPQSYTTVYWDTASHDVYLLINNLPAPASDKQYQVWALLDGKPIDLGMIDNQYFIGQHRLLMKAKNVQRAQAFAITLENKGGNPTPKGDMYVMGNP